MTEPRFPESVLSSVRGGEGVNWRFDVSFDDTVNEKW